MSSFTYRHAHLHCDGIALNDLAAEHGTPLYVYSANTLRANYRRLALAFAPLDPLICFAVKANFNLALLRLLKEEGAGFDIVYCYAGHNIALPMHFLQKRRNHRTDEYGGNLENRARLFRELIEDTKEAVGDSCAVAVRLAVDELLGEEGITSASEGRDVVAWYDEILAQSGIGAAPSALAG